MNRWTEKAGTARRCLLAVAVAATVLAAQVPDHTIALDTSAVDGELSGKQAELYRFALASGEYVRIDIELRGVDAVAQILDAEGKPVAEFDFDNRKQGHEQVELVADKTRDYSLSIKARYPRDLPGGYRVQIAARRTATVREQDLYDAHRLSTESQRLNGLGKYDEAIRSATSALAMAQSALGPDGAYIGYLLARLAFLERTTGAYAKSEQTFLRAIAIDRLAVGEQDPQTARALGGLGLVYMAMDDYAKAEPLLQDEVDSTSRALGSEHPSLVSYLMDLSLLHENRKDLERALQELKRAVAIAGKTLEPDDFAFIAAVHNLGNLYSNLRDYQSAEPLLQRALSMIEAKFGPEHPYVVNPLQNLGSIARLKKQYPRALELYSRAHAVRQKALGDRHPDTAALLINIANLYASEGEYAKALELDHRALEVIEAALGPYHSLTRLALGNIANAYAAQGDLGHAVEYQRRYDDVLEKNIALNVAIGSEREKLAYMNSIAEVTDRTITLHVLRAPLDQAACDLAVLVLLQRHGRVLDVMSGSRAALRKRLDTEDGKLLEALDQTNTKLATLALSAAGKAPAAERHQQIDDLQARREGLESAMSGRSEEFRAQAQPVSLDAVRRAIPRDAALVEFVQYRPFDSKAANELQAYAAAQYAVYVLRREGKTQWCDLGSAKEIDDAVAALRAALRDSHRKDVKELARSLDRKVAQPVRALIGDATQLLIAPDGALSLVPFEALVDERGAYLLERYSITYLSSGRDLLRMQVTRNSKSGPLVIADPFFGEAEPVQMTRAGQPPAKLARNAARGSVTTAGSLSGVYFAPLAGTALEARAIKALFPAAGVLTGREATTSALRGVDAPSILHIATHGFFLQPVRPTDTIDNPLLQSGLALAGANLSRSGVHEGIFTALEASGLNLWGTQLVTLSACDTGVGEVKNGEGVYGLRRAFFLAGAETLVMSLWPVSDYVTRELMTAYYTGLQKGLGRGEALRLAKLAVLARERLQHPYYWASFIQSGDWTKLHNQ